ncbi:MAG: hypothetical protein CMC15_17755 [Flavobacteriaceae bacterium]|jgi:hypothetical protein|nr:hypothetical protein [Flavobacteriaceae bacterium]
MISGSSTVPEVSVKPKEKASRHIYYHVFQIHYGLKRGWVDEMITEDWGEAHKLKEECKALYPESYGWKYRIITRRLPLKAPKKKGTGKNE